MKFYQYAPLLQPITALSWLYEEIKSSVDWFSPINLHKPTIVSDPTHCMRMCTRHDSCDTIRPIQVTGRSNLVLRSDRTRKLRCRIGFLKEYIRWVSLTLFFILALLESYGRLHSRTSSNYILNCNQVDYMYTKWSPCLLYISWERSLFFSRWESDSPSFPRISRKRKSLIKKRRLSSLRRRRLCFTRRRSPFQLSH